MKIVRPIWKYQIHTLHKEYPKSSFCIQFNFKLATIMNQFFLRPSVANLTAEPTKFDCLLLEICMLTNLKGNDLPFSHSTSVSISSFLFAEMPLPLGYQPVRCNRRADKFNQCLIPRAQCKQPAVCKFNQPSLFRRSVFLGLLRSPRSANAESMVSAHQNLTGDIAKINRNSRCRTHAIYSLFGVKWIDLTLQK